MTKEAIISELISIIEFIDESNTKIDVEYNKYQVTLTNTLRLLTDASPTLAKMKGDADSLKGYLVKTTTEIRDITLQPYRILKGRMEKVLELIQSP
ncbi:MAG: hypothetical protein ACFFDM_03960 [Candidatus Thorarchaeota archaeon]